MKTVYGEISYDETREHYRRWQVGVVVHSDGGASCPGWDEYVATREEAIELANDLRDDYLVECLDQDIEAKAGEGVQILSDEPAQEIETVQANRELRSVMTVEEVSTRYGKANTTIRTSIYRGYIPARKSGRTWLIRRADAEARWGKSLEQQETEDVTRISKH